ncbi:CHASE2 domain-containing protein [Azospirillum brasilense]|uniref:CHASE2 domain-containing protein n=1 Tax=Azospirillum brasilense TaxID=192 RepID=A0A560CIX8_AZOBR|nr:CHASE2 domain-containing protein [Azospirillum brasilense]TWA84823.1 CHASE2 domain-containing protein [Azospirillum brasilense]
MPLRGAKGTFETARRAWQGFIACLFLQCTGWRRLGDRLLKLSFVPALIVSAAVFNPLDISGSSGRTSLDAYRRIATSVYPDKGQKKIVVVQIDDTSLAVNGESYPPSFDFYARLIQKLKDAGAESILLDLMIIDRNRPGEPGGLDRLVSAIADFPVFMTVARSSQQDDSGCATAGRQNVEDLRLAVKGEPHPLIRDGASHVDLFPDSYCGSPRLSAALAVYNEYCGRSEACQGSRNDPLVNPDAFRNMTLTIEWGRVWPAGAEAVHPDHRRLAAECPDGSLLDKAGNFLRTLMPFESGVLSNAPADCRYHPVIRAEWLTAPESATGVDGKALADLLAGRIVVVGAMFSGVQDVGPSPVFGIVPGMFLHAMAIDNLIVRGAGFMKEWSKLGLGDLDLSVLVELAAMALVALAARRIGIWLAPRTLLSAVAWTLLLMAAGSLVGLAFSTWLVWLTGLEPVNWIGVAVAGAAVAGPARIVLAKRFEELRVLEAQEKSQSNGGNA